VAAREPYAEHLAGWTGPWNFAGAEVTAERLERAGFVEIDTWLEPYPITPENPLAFMTTVCLGPHLQRLPEELRAGFAEAVCDLAGPELDYVRLNVDAKKPS
jgi:trans-aconitate 2-methyltransferase